LKKERCFWRTKPKTRISSLLGL